MIDTLFLLVLVLNALWFGAGFRFFWIKAANAARVLVPRDQRSSPLFETIVAAVVFLGGMNLALSLLSLLILFSIDSFASTAARAIVCSVFFVAHMSQFLGNLPIALKENKGNSTVWSVLTGSMLFIFVVDGVLAGLNLTMVVLVLLS